MTGREVSAAPAEPRAAPSPRFYDLDALRAVAMFLGVVLHSTIFVLAESNNLWPIHVPEAEGNPYYDVILGFIHGFRMPVFFLLSGFFTALLWQRRGLRALAMQRLKRVGIPLAVACLTVLPLSIWLISISAFDAGGEAKELYDFPMWVLPLIWIENLGHLWFLWYLLLLLALFLLGARAGLQFRHPAWWLVIPVSMGISLFMVEPIYGSDNSSTPIPDWTVFFTYACFFTLGVFFYCRGMAVRRWWTAALIPAGLLFWGGHHLLEQYLAPYDGNPGNAGEALMLRNNLTLFAVLLETAFAWMMCFGLMGLFRWVASRESFMVRYFSDASYWMYLFHLPLVILGQQLVLDLSMNYHLKFLAVLVGVSVVLMVTYQFAVRYSFIGNALNGPRTRRQPRPAAQGA